MILKRKCFPYFILGETSTSECISSNDAQKVRDNPKLEQLLDTIKNARNATSNAIKLPAGKAAKWNKSIASPIPHRSEIIPQRLWSPAAWFFYFCAKSS